MIEKDSNNHKMKQKYFKYIKFIIPGIIFFVLMRIASQNSSISPAPISMIFVLALVSSLLLTKYNILSSVISILFSISSFIFLITIGQNALQRYYIILASLLFMITLLGIRRFFNPNKKPSREETVRLIDSGFNLNQSIVMFTVFLISSGIYGIYMIAQIETWQMMLGILAGIYFSTYYLIRINFIKSQELELHLDYYKNRTFKFYSFLMALIVLEISWTMTFLPINHLTFGAIVLSIYFSFWNIIKIYLRNNLTKNNFLNNIFFLALAIVLIILTSRLSIN